MRAFFQKHKTLVLIIAVLLGTALLAGATVGVLIITEPWADAGDTASVNTSGLISSSEVSSETSTSAMSSMSDKEILASLSAMNSSALPEGVYFYENFYNKLKASDGWAKDAGVSGGKYKGGGIVLTGYKPVTSLRDYAVEAEITVNMFPETTTQLSVAAILGRYVASGETGGGFEVGLTTVNKTGDMYIRVYDRLKKKNVCSFETISFEANRAYTITAVFAGNELGVFVDGEFAGKTTVENRAGGVGMARSGYTALFDNFTVRKATSAELSTMKNPPKPTINTSSNESLPEGVFFYEDFEDKVKTSNGWNLNANTTDGQYVGKNILLTGHSQISAMKNYVIESEIFIDAARKYEDGSLPGTNVASIIGRYATVGDQAGGIEVAACIQTSDQSSFVRVYDRINKKQLAAFRSVPIYGNQYCKVTAVFSGTTLAVFVDDAFVGKVTVPDRAGTAGLSHNGYDAYFDNFTVREPTQEELTAAGLK